ncbi:MAG: zf-HC2 domain-containing protein, partial [Chloroflexi bacterium]|nr:zf-HC2 domain-containing protein [Chloroflexota bacterium]
MQGFTTKEIAEKLNITEENVRQRRTRALRRLKEFLRDLIKEKMKDNIKVSRVALERLLQEIKALEGHLSDAEIAAYCLNLTTPEEQQRSDAEIAAYCLNLTTPEEQQRIEAHLRSCAACAEEVAEHQKAQAYWASDENRARVRDRRERVFAALGLTRPP